MDDGLTNESQKWLGKSLTLHQFLYRLCPSKTQKYTCTWIHKLLNPSAWDTLQVSHNDLSLRVAQIIVTRLTQQTGDAPACKHAGTSFTRIQSLPWSNSGSICMLRFLDKDSMMTGCKPCTTCSSPHCLSLPWGYLIRTWQRYHLTHHHLIACINYGALDSMWLCSCVMFLGVLSTHNSFAQIFAQTFFATSTGCKSSIFMTTQLSIQGQTRGPCNESSRASAACVNSERSCLSLNKFMEYMLEDARLMLTLFSCDIWLPRRKAHAAFLNCTRKVVRIAASLTWLYWAGCCLLCGSQQSSSTCLLGLCKQQLTGQALCLACGLLEP